MKDSPIFILSQARSGSTLVQRVLNQTPEVLIQGESLGLSSQLARSFSSLTTNEKEHRWFISPVEDEAEMISRAEKRLRNPLDFSATVCSLSLPRLTRIYRGLFMELFNPTGKDLRWGFKEIRCCEDSPFLAELILTLFPKAKVVFTVRNPVDQLGSKFATNWWPDESLEEAISLWDRQATHFKSAVATFPGCVLCRYEDFTTVPGLYTMLSWLGIVPAEFHRSTAFGLEKVGTAPCRLNFSREHLGQIKSGLSHHQDLYPELSTL
jgi:hypothetical protein